MDKRSYEFGRIVAVLEYIEKTAEPDRTPRVINRIGRYVQNPTSVIGQLEVGIRSVYIKKLKGGLDIKCEKIYQDAMHNLSEINGFTSAKLTPDWVFGYNLQKMELYKKSEEATETDTTGQDAPNGGEWIKIKCKW